MNIQKLVEFFFAHIRNKVVAPDTCIVKQVVELTDVPFLVKNIFDLGREFFECMCFGDVQLDGYWHL